MIRIASITWVSLAIGFIFGFLGQRSRMCFIGGWRDFFLIKDTYLLKGFLSFLISASVFFFIFNQAGYFMRNYPWYDRPPITFDVTGLLFWDIPEIVQYRNMEYCELLISPIYMEVGSDLPVRGVQMFGYIIPNELILTLGAALVMGFFSTMANGCPIRQHVMASSGNVSAMLYILAFYAAVLVYDKYLVKYLNDFVNIYMQLSPEFPSVGL